MAYSYAVGIDVSKKTLDVCILSEALNVHHKFSNSTQGISEISDFIHTHHVDPKSPVVIESTGDYHLLTAFTLAKDFNVRIINPIIARHHMQTTVRKVKSDKVDSRMLAELALKQDLPTHIFSIEELQKRKLVTFIDTMEQHLSALKLSLRNIQKVSGDFQFSLHAVSALESQLKQLEEILKNAHLELDTLVRNQELVSQIDAVKGIGRKTALKVVALLEDRVFPNKRSMVAFTGLDVTTKQSGKWKGKTRITKRGNPQLRKYLVQIAWGLLTHNTDAQEYMARYKAKGRKYLELKVILARRVLRMIFGAMRTHSIFDPAFL